MMNENKLFTIGGCSILVLIVALVAFFSAYTPVKFGEVKAVTRFGKLTGIVFQPGLNWKIPIVDGTERVRTVVLTYETSDNPDTSNADFTDYAVSAQTLDGQQISIKYSLQFRIIDASYVLQNFGNEAEIVENIVKARSRSLARLIAQQYTAEQLYGGTNVFGYVNQVAFEGSTVDGVHHSSLNEAFELNGITLADEGFLVRKIEFDPDYIQAIEQQQIEEEKIETARYQAQQAVYEAERQAELAKGAAAERVTLAEADSQVKRITSEAEAYAIETKGKALKRNPEVLQLEFIDKLTNINWGFLPSDSVTPFLPIDPLEGITSP